MAETTQKGTLRFLVVDDVAMGRSVLKSLLSKYGTVDQAEDGESALERYREAVENGGAYDLAFLDVRMPGMDGITLLRELRSFEKERGLPAMKVSMATAADGAHHVRQAIAAGALGYVLKPFDVQKIHALLERLELVS